MSAGQSDGIRQRSLSGTNARAPVRFSPSSFFTPVEHTTLQIRSCTVDVDTRPRAQLEQSKRDGDPAAYSTWAGSLSSVMQRSDRPCQCNTAARDDCGGLINTQVGTSSEATGLRCALWRCCRPISLRSRSGAKGRKAAPQRHAHWPSACSADWRFGPLATAMSSTSTGPAAPLPKLRGWHAFAQAFLDVHVEVKTKTDPAGQYTVLRCPGVCPAGAARLHLATPARRCADLGSRGLVGLRNHLHEPAAGAQPPALPASDRACRRKKRHQGRDLPTPAKGRAPSADQQPDCLGSSSCG